MKHLFLALFFISSALPGLAQETETDKIGEDMFRLPDEETAFPARYDGYAGSLIQKLDLNSADEEQLRSMHLLTEKQIESILHHRVETGFFQSVYELQVIDGLDEPLIRKLMAHLLVGDFSMKPWSGVWHRLLQPEEGHLLVRWESVLNPQSGYRSRNGTHAAYAGPPVSQYFRLRGQSADDFSYGLSTERDAGERFAWNPRERQFGPDFISGFLVIRNKRKIRQLIVGDYRVAFGQGLVQSGGFSVGKGAESVVSVRKASAGISSYTSSSESGYLRGAGITVGLNPHVEAGMFVSHARRDGSMELSSDSISFLKSVAASGYHRTASEWRRRGVWTESMSGATVRYTGRSWNIGLLAQTRWLSDSMVAGVQVYDRLDFRGRMENHLSMCFNAHAGSCTFFGESSVVFGGAQGQAWIAGALVAPAPSFDVSWVVRSYASGYHAAYADPLSENSVPRNEQGVYIGWDFKPGRKYRLSGYVDFFRFPDVQYRMYQPASGSDFLMRQTFRLNRKTFFYLQFKREEKPRNRPGTMSFYATEQLVRFTTILQAEHPISGFCTARLRLHRVVFHRGLESSVGFFGAVDLLAHWRRWKLSWRYGLFDAEDSDVRIYTFERDVWSAFSFASLSGRGARSAVVAGCAISRNWDVWARVTFTRYDDRDYIGYGLERSEGPLRSEVKVQMRYRW